MLPIDPLEHHGDWECPECHAKVNGFTVHALVRELQNEAESIKPISPVEIEDFIAKLCKTLHPNHYVVIGLKRKLLDVYRLTPDPEDPGQLRSKLERMLETGRQVLDVVSVIEPELSLNKGRLLRNLHGPTLRLAKLNLNEKKITMADFLGITKQSIKNMKAAVKCLEDFDLFYVASAGSNVASQTD